MELTISEYTADDIAALCDIWNEVVKAGNAFPQIQPLTLEEGKDFFASQTYCGAARAGERIVGMYILHPNNVGRCGHIANASFAVDGSFRGMHIGEALVRDCLEQAERHGFRIMQFNAVVSSNTAARKLYEKLGFVQLGVIKDGFMLADGSYCDIIPYYYTIVNN